VGGRDRGDMQSLTEWRETSTSLSPSKMQPSMADRLCSAPPIAAGSRLPPRSEYRRLLEPEPRRYLPSGCQIGHAPEVVAIRGLGGVVRIEDAITTATAVERGAASRPPFLLPHHPRLPQVTPAYHRFFSMGGELPTNRRPRAAAAAWTALSICSY
jgi:hypothetical protein